MKQLEIQFFWPLTEQTTLDLDYSECASHLYYIKAQGQPKEGPFANTTYPTTVQPIVTIKADHLTIQTPHMPWYRKLAFKLLGFKWK
jgi:hypothetical protein